MSNEASDLNNKQMFQSNAKYATHLTRYGLKCAILSLLLICSTFAFGQSWELKVGGSKEDQARVVIPTIDHGNLVVGFSESYGEDNDVDILAIRTDVDGTIIWQKVFDDAFEEFPEAAIELEDGSFLVVGSINTNFSAPKNVYLLKVNRRGRKVWSKHYEASVNEKGLDIVKSPDGGFMIVGETQNAVTEKNNILVIKVDDEGVEEWRNSFGTSDKDDSGAGIVVVPDGYIIAVNAKENLSPFYNNVALYKLDLRGEYVWAKFYGINGVNEQANDILLTQDNKIVFVGSSTDYNRSLIVKCELNGDVIWYREFDAAPVDELLNSIVETPRGELVSVGFGFSNSAYSKILLLKVDQAGNLIWNRSVGEEKTVDIGEDISMSADGGFVIVGYSSGSEDVFTVINDVVVTKLDGDGQVATNHLSGQVNHLLDGCGGVDEMPLKDWLVQVEGENITYYGTTDENGKYDVSVDPGSYKLSVLKPNDHWGICNPVAVFAEFSEFYDTTITNFSVYAAEECPFMQVDVTVPFITNNLVQCDNATYTVNYCNLGPVTAEDAYVEVKLDEELQFNASSITPSAVDPVENRWTFQLGDVASNECGSFKITVSRDCDGLVNGQAIVVKAEIFPNAICTEPDPNWDHSSIQLSADCSNDSIIFKVRNIGTEPMEVPSEYVVIEDQIVFLQGPIDILAPNKEQLLKFESTGATYRMIARQSEGHPGHSLPTVAIEGCAFEGLPTSHGYYDNFPENDRDADIDIDVQEVISPEETTLLKGHPQGYKDFILDQETDIEYTIIFSNTWTDTINRVVIRDTISPFLDIQSVEPGASSHPYDFEIYNTGVVKITLNGIQLQPVGSAEEGSSQGFVKFRISQKPNNPLGTEITNSAAVYFDYHAPQMTNEVFYVIDCANFLQQGCLQITNVTENFPGVKIKVAPNPFFDKATIDFEGITLSEVDLRMYDMMGRLVRTEKHRASSFEVYRNNLPSGMYTFQILTGGQTLATGKIIAR